MKKKGFTLVELSIVLVIIGLLIGGILAAQSMIGTAKIQAFVRQIGQFDASLENFKTKYNQIPGDTNLMGTQPGNNNGYIEASCGAYDWGNEIGKYWSDLSATGLTNGNGAAYVDNSLTPPDLGPTSTQLPLASVGKAAYFTVYGKTSGNNYYFVGHPTGGCGGGCGCGLSSTAAFTPIEALAVDQKVDDSNPSSGNIIGTDRNLYYMYGGAPYTQTSSGSTCTNGIAGSTYLSNSSAVTCSLIIRIGAQTGDLQ